MLSTLPLIYPRDAHSLWYTPSNSFSLAPTAAPIDPLAPLPNPNAAQANLLADTTISGPILPTPKATALSPLAQLEQDERELAARKLSIQRFGATWIRPPGIPKTYQTYLDEEAEREDELAEEEGNNEGGFMEEEMDMGEEEGEEQVDLDAEVPEGEEFLGSDLDDEEDELESELGGELDMDANLSELEEVAEQYLDLDAEVPEAEADTLWGDDSDDFESGSEEGTAGDILVTPLHGSRPQVSTPTTLARENERGNRLSLSPGPGPRAFMRRAPQHYAQRYQSSSPQSGIPSSSPQQLLFSHDDRMRGAEYTSNLGFRRISDNQAHSDDDEMEVDF